MEAIRCFISIEIPEELKSKIVELQENLKKTKARLKLVEKQNLHITLKFLGNVEKEKLEEVKKELSKIKFKKFKISLEKIGVFPNPNFIRVIWIGVGNGREQLLSLYNIVENSLSKLNFKKEKFEPHLTIARNRSRIGINEILSFIKENSSIKIGEFDVNEFLLMKSKLTKEGPIYSEIARFILQK